MLSWATENDTFMLILTVLGTKEVSGGWRTKVLSSSHNGENPVEVNKVRAQHPGEPQSIYNNRVLGTMAVTRGQ